MGTAGWAVDSPQAAIASMRTLAAQHLTTQADLDLHQQALARADIACDTRSHLRATAHTGEPSSSSGCPRPS
jgi:hypothetical protein